MAVQRVSFGRTSFGRNGSAREGGLPKRTKQGEKALGLQTSATLRFRPNVATVVPWLFKPGSGICVICEICG